jgi:hypothetical protein
MSFFLASFNGDRETAKTGNKEQRWPVVNPESLHDVGGSERAGKHLPTELEDDMGGLVKDGRMDREA